MVSAGIVACVARVVSEAAELSRGMGVLAFLWLGYDQSVLGNPCLQGDFYPVETQGNFGSAHGPKKSISQSGP